MHGVAQATIHDIARALKATKTKNHACVIQAYAGQQFSFQLQHDRRLHSAATLEDLCRATRWQNTALVAAFPHTRSKLDCHVRKKSHGITAALHRMSTRWRISAGPGLTKMDLHVVRKSTRWRQLIVLYVNPLLGTGICRYRTELIYDVKVQERGRE